jgi:hypothetical protein
MASDLSSAGHPAASSPLPFRRAAHPQGPDRPPSTTPTKDRPPVHVRRAHTAAGLRSCRRQSMTRRLLLTTPTPQAHTLVLRTLRPKRTHTTPRAPMLVDPPTRLMRRPFLPHPCLAPRPPRLPVLVTADMLRTRTRPPRSPRSRTVVTRATVTRTGVPRRCRLGRHRQSLRARGHQAHLCRHRPCNPVVLHMTHDRRYRADSQTMEGRSTRPTCLQGQGLDPAHRMDLAHQQTTTG